MDELLDLPFDHYERHTITREVAITARDYFSRPALRVLDVGGAASSLARFLPDDEVVAIDLDRSSGGSGDYVQGSGVDLPFRDDSFDITSCHDTLEHIPVHLRDRFLGEMLRVASAVVVIQGPFDQPGVREAEGLVMRIAGDLYGSDCSTVKFLSEHAECGLSDLGETVSRLEGAGYRSIVVPNGALDEWMVKMLVKHHVARLDTLGVRSFEFDRWSNRTFLPGADDRPTYRHAIVACRTNEERLLRLLQERFRLPPRREAEEDRAVISMSAVRSSVATLVNLVQTRLQELTSELQAERAAHENALESGAALERRLWQLGRDLQDREETIHKRQEVIDDLTHQLIAIHGSMGYRLIKRYRRMTNWLFPPGSVRGIPYHAGMKTVRAAGKAPRRVMQTAQRGARARNRYGTVGVVNKGIRGLRTPRSGIADPVKYALAIPWDGTLSPGRPRQRRDGEPIVVNWLVPTVSEGGGLRTIFRFYEHLEKQGFKQRLYEMPIGRPRRAKEDELRQEAKRLFGVDLKEVGLDFEHMQDADIVLASSWHTAYPVLKHSGAGRKFFFVQDFEPYFSALGTEAVLAENTYRFGFTGVTAGRWLAYKLSADYGMTCHAFNLAVDPAVYFPKPYRKRSKIFYYARPATPRRGFELGMQALDIFHSRHPEYEIVLAGGEIPQGSWKFPFDNRGYLSEDRLNDLYNQCGAALVISLTNCSLLPLEIMSAGCPVVTNVGANNELALPPDSAIYAIPSPSQLADALEQAIKIEDRDRLVTLARQYSWEEQFATVERILFEAAGAKSPA
jgi:glycosyltransferase involved in cell wall biosynthesis